MEAFSFPVDWLRTLSKRDQEKILKQLAQETEKILKEKIREVYAINSQIRTAENYIPLGDMLRIVGVEYSTSPLSFTVTLDENRIIWVDKRGQDIHEVPAPWETYKEIGNSKVRSFEEHWKTPIEGMRENRYFIEETKGELLNFINRNIRKIISQVGGK